VYWGLVLWVAAWAASCWMVSRTTEIGHQNLATTAGVGIVLTAGLGSASLVESRRWC
jgi:hypothetical protein